MEVLVEKDGCISCGLCVNTCPEIFRFDSDSLAEAYTQPNDELKEKALQAAENCPVNVIKVEKENE